MKVDTIPVDSEDFPGWVYQWFTSRVNVNFPGQFPMTVSKTSEVTSLQLRLTALVTDKRITTILSKRLDNNSIRYIINTTMQHLKYISVVFSWWITSWQLFGCKGLHRDLSPSFSDSLLSPKILQKPTINEKRSLQDEDFQPSGKNVLIAAPIFKRTIWRQTGS